MNEADKQIARMEKATAELREQTADAHGTLKALKSEQKEIRRLTAEARSVLDEVRTLTEDAATKAASEVLLPRLEARLEEGRARNADAMDAARRRMDRAMSKFEATLEQASVSFETVQRHRMELLNAPFDPNSGLPEVESSRAGRGNQ